VKWEVPGEENTYHMNCGMSYSVCMAYMQYLLLFFALLTSHGFIVTPIPITQRLILPPSLSSSLPPCLPPSLLPSFFLPSFLLSLPPSLLPSFPLSFLRSFLPSFPPPHFHPSLFSSLFSSLLPSLMLLTCSARSKVMAFSLAALGLHECVHLCVHVHVMRKNDLSRTHAHAGDGVPIPNTNLRPAPNPWTSQDPP